jgi:hypothetical protein
MTVAKVSQVPLQNASLSLDHTMHAEHPSEAPTSSLEVQGQAVFDILHLP